MHRVAVSKVCLVFSPAFRRASCFGRETWALLLAILVFSGTAACSLLFFVFLVDSVSDNNAVLPLWPRN